MPNSINNLSPTFRDFLLERNVITDTIENSGLLPLLQGVGEPSRIFSNPETVQPSVDIEVDGDLYKDLNIVNNKFQVRDEEYRSIEINNIPGDTSAFSVLDNASFYQELNVTQNPYKANDSQYEDASIFLNTRNVPTIQMGAYLDEFGNLNIGGPSTQALDVVGSILGGGGVGFDPNGGGAVPDFDVRSSLAGRVLSSTGVINDTKLGQLSVGYLASALGNNVAFNVQQQTLGHIDLNPLNLIKGGSIIRPNFNITVAKGTLGVAVDLLERILGFETPFSLLENSSSIFVSESGGISTIDRANSMIQNSGKGQILSLFANLNANSDQNLIGERVGYVPEYEDKRTESGFNQGPLNGGAEIYAFNDSAKLDKYPSQLEGGFNDDFDELNKFTTNNSKSKEFTWFDTNLNAKNSTTDEDEISNMPNETPDFDVKKSLLYKTQELFRSNKMRTLTVGHGVNVGESTQTQSSVKQGFMSKGSAVLSEAALNGTVDNASSVFCRTWTTYDRYSQIQDLQKHSGLEPNARQNGEEYPNSVLDDNGMVRIGPYEGEDIKKFMFSIENLAWSDEGSLSKLLPCEIGEGDLLTGNKGRIMWFPPYDMSFNESTSVSWDKNNFIGRGEPIYTYNNTERMGTLSWKIVVDHPNYMNFMDNMSSDEINSFFSGCLQAEAIRKRILTSEELEQIKVSEVVKQVEKVDDEVISPISFNVYFSNDNSDIPVLYENGRKNGVDETEEIDYFETPSGIITEPSLVNPIDLVIIGNYGVGTTIGQGPVGSVGRVYNDNTNFGLNGQTNSILIGDELIEGGWQDPKFTTTLNAFLKDKCKFCKIKINGYASVPGTSANNLQLSKNRANSIKNWLLNESGIIGADDEFRDKRVSITSQGSGETEAGGSGCVFGQEDSEACKRSRLATITIEYDPKLKEASEPTVTKVDENAPTPIPTVPVSRFYSECHYFEKLEQTDNFVYENIKQKIRHFHPGFHSITPEGFNSRLTFLQQCTRQGPTNKAGNPDNLSFGKPPVCILRIGDFYHTKIIIDNLTFDYDPLVWDLNPEGVGVQPMIVTVSMSFAFIGGSSLNSPINKLQNAVSFNYFANTEIYDPRSQRVIVKTELNSDKEAPGEIVEGSIPQRPIAETINLDPRGLDNNTNKLVIDQLVIADNENLKESTNTNNSDSKSFDNSDIINNLSFIGNAPISDGDDFMDLDFKYNHKGDIGYEITEIVEGFVYLRDSRNKKSKIFLESIEVRPNGVNSFIIDSSKGNSVNIINKNTNGIFTVTIVLGEDKINEIKNVGEFGNLRIEWETSTVSNVKLNV